MVALSDHPPRSSHVHHDDAPTSCAPTSARYSTPIDQERARIDPRTNQVHTLTFHEVFQTRPRLTKAERRELQIKQTALRIAAGIEFASLRELAKRIGCTHTALDNAVARLCERVGMRKFHVADSTREKQRAARRRQLAR